MSDTQKAKFHPYQRVWIMENNRPCELTVFATVESMAYDKKGIEFLYHLVSQTVGTGWGNNTGKRVSEDIVFATKADLVESL